jgi:hypothetical protein
LRYLCLIYLRERELAGTPADVVLAVEQACCDWEQVLRESGSLLAVEALQPTGTATTVRVRNGRTLVSDGPFAETKEQLAGFYLIDARDLNDAIRIASQIPPARFGGIEVRPVRDG